MFTPAQNAAKASTMHSAAAARILIVEDNVDAARLLEILLRTRAHTVSVAHDGRTALQMAKAEAPTVMLVDIGLPDLSGYELARQIRSDEALRAIRLIALTGYDEPAARALTAASGFDHHMVKPLDRCALETLLQQVSQNPGADTGPYSPSAAMVLGEA